MKLWFSPRPLWLFARRRKARLNRNQAACRSKRSGITSTRLISSRSSNRSSRGKPRDMPTSRCTTRSTSRSAATRSGRTSSRSCATAGCRSSSAFEWCCGAGFIVFLAFRPGALRQLRHVRHQRTGDPRLPPHDREEPPSGPRNGLCLRQPEGHSGIREMGPGAVQSAAPVRTSISATGAAMTTNGPCGATSTRPSRRSRSPAVSSPCARTTAHPRSTATSVR